MAVHSLELLNNSLFSDLFIIHANQKEALEAAKKRVLAAHLIKPEPCEPLPLFYGLID